MTPDLMAPFLQAFSTLLQLVVGLGVIAGFVAIAASVYSLTRTAGPTSRGRRE
jgi:hypothetical protein